VWKRLLDTWRTDEVGVEPTEAGVAEEMSGWAVEGGGGFAKRARVAFGIVPCGHPWRGGSLYMFLISLR
jgi:hypothetical protein